MKPRMLERTIRKSVATFPAVVVTGPRQSGKTTLLKSLCGRTHAYVSLEARSPEDFALTRDVFNLNWNSLLAL